MNAKTLRKKSICRGAVICIRVEEVRKGLNTSTLKFDWCKKKRTAVLIHCIKIAVLIWWRWGESNPRPKNVCQEFLRAQSLFYISLTVSPNDRLYSSAAPKV